MTHLGSSRLASRPGLRLRRSENTPSSHFLVILTGRPNASNRNDRARTVISTGQDHLKKQIEKRVAFGQSRMGQTSRPDHDSPMSVPVM